MGCLFTSWFRWRTTIPQRSYKAFIFSQSVTPGDGTHIRDEEVQPAPRVGEVGLEAVRHPLEDHLYDEDVGKDLVGVLQDYLDGPTALYVDVLKRLRQ